MSSATERQRLFARAIAEGHTGHEAAARAGYRGAQTTLAPLASRLRAKPHIAALIQRYRAELGAAPPEGVTSADLEQPPDQVARALRLSTERKLELLAGIAQSRESRDADRIRAIELAARLDGDLGPDRATEPGPATATATATVVVVVDNGRGPDDGHR